MPRLAWITDPHLNFVSSERLEGFINEINESRPDILLIGGDIGEADSFEKYLHALADACRVPIYFVFGNHDYYRGSIANVRLAARRLTHKSNLLHWLPETGVVRISESTSLIGHGGWGDGQIGDFLASDVVLNDYLLIEELRATRRGESRLLENILTPALLERLKSLGQDAAASLERHLHDALGQSNQIIVLTHVPPFLEACWHEGRLSDENWSPHFTCHAVGEVLRDTMRRHPDKSMTVLCGHSHGAGRAQILDNLEVVTGGAVYREPEVQRVWEVT
ncbi:MAG TPA: metallophosphoesterase [Planctomycetaceae bacterium]|nr:metallophosphoesterase [Planctomycetaceae bacterium]